MRKPDFYIVSPRIPTQTTPNRPATIAKASEDLGYDRVWVTEENSRDAFCSAIEALLGTKSITLGTNIVSVYARTPLLLAMSTFSLEELAPYRFVLGIGPGGKGFVVHGHGMRLEHPLQRVRETIHIVRGLLKGGRIDYRGRVFDVQNFKLRFKPPRTDTPIYISALNPKMIQLAGEMADGVILSHMPLEAVEDVRRNIQIGASRSKRNASKVEICANLEASLNRPETISNTRKAVAWHLAATTYDWLVSHTPYLDAAKKIARLWYGPQREEAIKGVSDDLLMALTLGCDEGTIRERLKKYLASGITPVIDPHGVRTERALQDTIELAGQCVIW